VSEIISWLSANNSVLKIKWLVTMNKIILQMYQKKVQKVYYCNCSERTFHNTGGLRNVQRASYMTGTC